MPRSFDRNVLTDFDQVLFWNHILNLGLGWAGLAGLGWAGLGWAGMPPLSSDDVVSLWIVFGGAGCWAWAELGLGWAGLGWGRAGWAGLGGWAGWAGWAGLGWAGLGWAGLGWAGLGWAGLGWAGCALRGLLGWAEKECWTLQ